MTLAPIIVAAIWLPVTLQSGCQLAASRGRREKAQTARLSGHLTANCPPANYKVAASRKQAKAQASVILDTTPAARMRSWCLLPIFVFLSANWLPATNYD